ncbi:MAG TPA: hypothetical protein VK165_10130, partial [Azonexus sp.]|nr:hypothetical protein [Azonexus sp.]
MSFSSGFATGLQAREMRDRREEEKKIRAEMAQVGQAMPEQVATDMPAPVDPSGADPGATTTATRFLGQTYDKPPSQADMLKARTQAMAGVYMRNGNPEAGLRLQQMAQQGVREEARFAQETRRNQRENEAADDESAYRRDLKEFSEKSRLRQNESVYGKAMEDYQSKLRDYQQRQAAGETGPRLGLAPTPPARPEYTMADNLADATGLIALQSRRGKVDPNLLMKFGEMVRSIQSEGVKEATQALQGGAPLDEVARMFNAAGQGKFDVANVVSDKTIQ